MEALPDGWAETRQSTRSWNIKFDERHNTQSWIIFLSLWHYIVYVATVAGWLLQFVFTIFSAQHAWPLCCWMLVSLILFLLVSSHQLLLIFLY